MSVVIPRTDHDALVDRCRGTVGLSATARRIIGVCGAPGSGKSTLTAELVASIGPGCVVVPMDGFHLAGEELIRLGRATRKGAVDTFDAHGYIALLRRLRAHNEPVVYAPTFRRDLEEPIAGAIAIDAAVTLVLTEGNYLLMDEPPWPVVREIADEIWFVDPTDEVRRERLIARHVHHGRDVAAATAWTLGTDEVNAVAVRATEVRADVVVRG